MVYLNERTYLFRAPSRRGFVASMVIALLAFTAINTFTATATAQDKAFSRLSDRSTLQGPSLADDGRGRYSVIGGDESFEFVRDGRRATIRFLCSPSPRCTDEMRTAQTLMAEPSGRGDMVFKDRQGTTVLRVTATGGATLFGGASFVPASVPTTGRAVVPQG